MWPLPWRAVRAATAIRSRRMVAARAFAKGRLASVPAARSRLCAIAAMDSQAALAAMAHNLLRAAGALASLPLAKARAATIRRDLIAVAARTARHGRSHITLHLPEGWHREHEWLNLLAAACGPPAAAA